jgi:hypothetical protein
MAAPQIQKEHAIETYKSLIQISVEGLKALALLNGGAAVALLAFLGNLAGKASAMPDMRCPMAFFLAGLVLCGVCFITSYLTQLTLYNESMGWSNERFYQKHKFWLPVTLLSVLTSILAFAFGSYSAVVRFH